MSIQTAVEEQNRAPIRQERSVSFFALVFSDPHAEQFVHVWNKSYFEPLCSAADYLRENWVPAPSHTVAPGEVSTLQLDLRTLLEYTERPVGEIHTEYQHTFGLLMSKDCPAYETEYCPQNFSVYRAQSLADIGGYYHAFGLEPSRDLPERMDHIALELEFMSWLICKIKRAEEIGGSDREEKIEICTEGQRGFLQQHLSWWVPAFCSAVRRKSDGGSTDTKASGVPGPPQSFYGHAAYALAAFINMERNRFEIPPPTELLNPNAIDLEKEMSCQECDLSNPK